MNQTPSYLSIMQRLKLATQANHDLIEKTPCMGRLFAKDYSLDEYRGLLEKMHGFISVYEPLMFESLDESLAAEFAHRGKLVLLDRDLLNYQLTPAQIAALPRCSKVQPIENVSECLGVWYVLEGSTLGGQMIARHMSQSFGAAVAGVTGFHTSYGDRTQAEWQDFQRIMEARFAPDNGGDIELAVRSAQLTFEYLGEWLRKV
jgi:heme oxygenase